MPERSTLCRAETPLGMTTVQISALLSEAQVSAELCALVMLRPLTQPAFRDE